MTEITDSALEKLVERARAAMLNARCQYSGFAVGAALLTSSGETFVGANIESSSYGATMCAERVALASALTDGADSFLVIVIATRAERPTMPCGICRQLLSDYAPQINIVSDANGLRQTKSIRDLFPDAFGNDDLARG